MRGNVVEANERVTGVVLEIGKSFWNYNQWSNQQKSHLIFLYSPIRRKQNLIDSSSKITNQLHRLSIGYAITYQETPATYVSGKCYIIVA